MLFVFRGTELKACRANHVAVFQDMRLLAVVEAAFLTEAHFTLHAIYMKYALFYKK